MPATIPAHNRSVVATVRASDGSSIQEVARRQHSGSVQAHEADESEQLAVPWRELPGLLGFSDDRPGDRYAVFTDAAQFIAGIRMVLGGVHHGQQDRMGDREVHIGPARSGQSVTDGLRRLRTLP